MMSCFSAVVRWPLIQRDRLLLTQCPAGCWPDLISLSLSLSLSLSCPFSPLSLSLSLCLSRALSLSLSLSLSVCLSISLSLSLSLSLSCPLPPVFSASFFFHTSSFACPHFHTSHSVLY